MTEENNNNNNNNNNEMRGLVGLIDLSADGIDLTPGPNFKDALEEIPVNQNQSFGREKHMPTSDYYWNSYAHFGIHEV